MSTRNSFPKNSSRHRQQYTPLLHRITFALLAMLIVVLLGWMGSRYLAFRKGANTASNSAGSSGAKASSAQSSVTTIESTHTPVNAGSVFADRPSPQLASKGPTDDMKRTPLIASYKDVSIRLPVHTEDLTEVALHQASFSYARPLSTPLRIADSGVTYKAHGTDRPAEQPHGLDAILDGSILRLYRRGAGGKMNTALDVGAKPGNTLLSPVDGTVVLVRKYKLYDKWNDIEIHIQPTGHPELDVVLIHITDAMVVAGDKVVGGLTELGKLRELSDKITLQLGMYTAKDDGGNHTHIQVNNAKDPLYKKKHRLRGAITLDSAGESTKETTSSLLKDSL